MDPTPTDDLDPGLTGVDARPVAGVENGYACGYRVRFDEAGPDGRIRTSTLLRYAQDVAWRHAEALGFDRRWYADRGLGWVVRALELDLHEPVAMGETLRAATAVVGHRRIWARRLGTFATRTGALVATVTTDWVLIDGRGRIMRIPGDFGVAFPNPEIGDAILRVDPAPVEPVIGRQRLAVRPQDLDPMGHVNNAVYLDWAEDALQSAGLPLDAVPRWARLEYLASAGPRAELELEVHGVPEAWLVRIRGAAGPELVRVAGGRGAADGRATPG